MYLQKQLNLIELTLKKTKQTSRSKQGGITWSVAVRCVLMLLITNILHKINKFCKKHFITMLKKLKLKFNLPPFFTNSINLSCKFKVYV